jgi:hypothetical protein
VPLAKGRQAQHHCCVPLGGFRIASFALARDLLLLSRDACLPLAAAGTIPARREHLATHSRGRYAREIVELSGHDWFWTCGYVYFLAFPDYPTLIIAYEHSIPPPVDMQRNLFVIREPSLSYRHMVE